MSRSKSCPEKTLAGQAHADATHKTMGLNKKPISKKGKAFIRLGYQYYSFEYTGSNNWVGGPDDMGITNMQMFTQIKDASDLYATFEVQF